MPSNVIATASGSVPLTPVRKSESTLKVLAKKAWEVVKFALKTIAFCWLYWMNATLFALGFMGGLVFSDRVDATITKLNTILRKQTTEITVLLAAGTFLSLPIAIASGAVFCGSYLGARIAKKAEAQP